MFMSRVAPRVHLVPRVCGSLHHSRRFLSRTKQHPPLASLVHSHHIPRHYTSAADNKQPPQLWTPLEPELEDVLVPRKLSVSPLESWLSLRYSLPPLLEAPQPLEDEDLAGNTLVLPPSVLPILEDGESPVPLSCKNVLEIRRRKMNRHKYKKLQKRTKFLRRRVNHIRRKRKQKKFEKDLERIWRSAGFKEAPEGWRTPKIFIKQQRSK